MTTTLSRRDEALNDVFTTALEGGIGYWSVCSEYRWSDGEGNQSRDFRAVIHDTEDDTEYVVDRGVITRGITRLYDHMHALHKEGNANVYQYRAIRNLRFGHYDEADFDAITGDMVVQFGLFGELVYN